VIINNNTTHTILALSAVVRVSFFTILAPLQTKSELFDISLILSNNPAKFSKNIVYGGIIHVKTQKSANFAPDHTKLRFNI
jgi:hypothetical protein